MITRSAILSECAIVILGCINIRRRLRKIGVNWTIPPKRVVRKALFSTRIWSRRCEHPVHAATVRGDIITTIKSTMKLEVKLGVMNVRSVRNKLDYVFDHIFDNDLDIVALTETWLSNEDNNNTHVITECSNHGYTLHHVPMNSGSTGGGVGVLINESQISHTIRDSE